MSEAKSSSLPSSRAERVSGLGYYGGKSPKGKIGPWIAGILPWHRDSCYVEPFAGMLGVLLCRRPVQIEIVNDRDGNLVCWWRMVRDHPKKFANLVMQTPRSRDLYREACLRLKAGISSPARRAPALHTQVRRLDRGVDKLSPELRDLAADACRAETGDTWRPRHGSHTSQTGKLTSAAIDARDFMRARKDRETRAHLPEETLVAIAGGASTSPTPAPSSAISTRRRRSTPISSSCTAEAPASNATACTRWCASPTGRGTDGPLPSGATTSS